MELPAILKEENVRSRAAQALLPRIVHDDGTAQSRQLLDEWANRGDNPDVKDKITDSDAVAVSMLSVKVPAQGSSGCRRSRWLQKYGTSW